MKNQFQFDCVGHNFQFLICARGVSCVATQAGSRRDAVATTTKTQSQTRARENNGRPQHSGCKRVYKVSFLHLAELQSTSVLIKTA